MAIYKRGKIYWYKFEFLGKLHCGSTRLRNERQACQFEAKLKSDLAMGLVNMAAVKPGPVFEDYAETFRQFNAVRCQKHPDTIRYYSEKMARLLEFKPLANQRIHLINEKLVSDYIEHRLKSVSIASVNRELAVLKRALRVAWKDKKLIPAPVSISMLPGEEPREFVLSYDQERAYLAVADDTLRDFAMLSLDTGVRAGEGVNLAWDDVHLEAAHGARLPYIHVREGGRKKKGRNLSISPRVTAMLENRRRFYLNAVYVFPGRSKGSHILVTSLDHQHARAREAARVDMTDGTVTRLPEAFVIHSLRHTFGTRLGESGADAFRIMKIMGHSSITTSEKYVHPTPEGMERAFEGLEAMNQVMRGDNWDTMLRVGTKSGTVPKKSS